jgi:hypothetical protein
MNLVNRQGGGVVLEESEYQPGFFRLRISENVLSAVAGLQKFAEVERAQPNFIYHTQMTPSDQYFFEQWNLWDDDNGIHADEAWETIVMRVGAGINPNTTFSGKRGRIGTGVLGKSQVFGDTCQGTSYATYSAAVIGGVDLGTGVPFIYFDAPYTEYTAYPDAQHPFPALDLSNVKRLTISVGVWTYGWGLNISNSDTGDDLFNIMGTYPSFVWAGTEVPAFCYYGLDSQTVNQSVYVRSIVSFR